MRKTVMLMAAAMLTYAPLSHACRDLVVFPKHLMLVDSGIGLRAHDKFVVVLIDHASNFEYTATVLRSFGQLYEPGMPITIKMIDGEANARCGNRFVAGGTYLISGNPTADALETSFYNRLNIPSSHERFAQYVHDVEDYAASHPQPFTFRAE